MKGEHLRPRSVRGLYYFQINPDSCEHRATLACIAKQRAVNSHWLLNVLVNVFMGIIATVNALLNKSPKLETLLVTFNLSSAAN
jgi:hypothetical protein